jgi:hypothetical protein
MVDIATIPAVAQAYEMIKHCQGTADRQLAENAHYAEQYLIALRTGQMSPPEFADLMQDLDAKVKAADAADAIETKVMLSHALNLAISVAGAL